MTMTLGQITYFMIIYDKNGNIPKFPTISPIFNKVFTYLPVVLGIVMHISCYRRFIGYGKLILWQIVATWLKNRANMGTIGILFVFLALLSFYIIVPSFMFLAYFSAILGHVPAKKSQFRLRNFLRLPFHICFGHNLS